MPLTAIDIVPLLRAAADKEPQVAAHELLITTADGTLALVSELIIR